ncbi:MAG: type II secretion system GspH family protein [Cyanobacteria bacterium]|nr:type II secretion system GspH family protein [Cyanobacteriota bacterium]
MRTVAYSAFTLAELLISLAVLGVISVFVIPKILNANEDKKRSAIAKEVAATIAGAYQNYRLRNTPLASTTLSDLLPFINYVSADTSSGISTEVTMHSGALLDFTTVSSFGGVSKNDSLYFKVKLDDMPEHDVCFVLTYPGRISTLPIMTTELGSPPPTVGSSISCPAIDPTYLGKWN